MKASKGTKGVNVPQKKTREVTFRIQFGMNICDDVALRISRNRGLLNGIHFLGRLSPYGGGLVKNSLQKSP